MVNSEQERGCARPKILSPVRSFEGGVRVINAGADELYCGVTISGIKDFVLYRGPSCEIPTYSELGRLVKYAHNQNVKVVVVANRRFMTELIEKATTNHIRSCIDEGIDALIIGDIGILSIIKDMDVGIPLYASTYMVSMNYEAVNFLEKLGFTRVILDRQLTLNEIYEIVQRSKIEIDIFVHGGGCSNINGNCYLYHSNFPAMKRAIQMTEGHIKSPCALPFEVYDFSDGQKRLGSVPIMDAFEYCSLCLLPKLVNIGITGFKIVGRCANIWYQESATKAYRELIDLLMRGQMESFRLKLESLRSGGLVPEPPALMNLKEFGCEQKRCYYEHLFHAPYKFPLSWQAWTKSQFKYVMLK